MATIAKLVLRIEAETRVLQNQLRDASRAVTKFSSDVEKSFKKIPNLNTLTVGGAPLTAKLNDVERQFDRTFNNLRRQAKKGIIDQTGFADQLRAAVRKARDESISLVGQLQQAGQITGRQASGAIARAERNAIKAETNILIGEAQSQLQRLENQFKSSRATLQTQRATGGLDPKEFQRLGHEAEAAFNLGWAAEMQRFSKDPRFTESMRIAFAQQFKGGGFGAGAAASTVERSIAVAKEASQAFVQTYQKTVQGARFDNLVGDKTSRQFRKTLDDANKELSRGLKTVRAQLESQGLLTPEALKVLNSQFQSAGRDSARGFFETFDKAMKEGATGSLQRFGTVATQVGRSMTAFLTVPILGAAGAALKLAGDAEQAGRKLESTFGPGSLTLSRQLAKLQHEIPATTAELENMAATFGELLIPLKLAPNVVADMSVQLIKAAKNVAVFRGVSTERGFNAIVNSLIGQSRELKKLGIEIDDQTIRDEAYRQGIARVGAQLSTTQKVMAGYSVILQRTKLVTNTLQDQQNTFNVRMLFFQSTLKQTAITIGQTILPMFSRWLVSLTQTIQKFQELSDTAKASLFIFAGIVAGIGPAILVLGQLARMIVFLRAAIVGIKAIVAGGSAGAAAAGFETIIGLSVGTFTFLTLAISLVGALAIALGRLTDALGDFKGVSAEFKQQLQEMTSAELGEAQSTNRLALQRLEAQREAFKRASGITELPGGFVIGGDLLGKQRREFIAMGEEIKKIKAEGEAINAEWTKVDLTQQRLNEGMDAYNAKVKAAQALANSDLLVEVWRRARIELSALNTDAANAKRTLSAGLRLQNADMITRGTEAAEKAISDLGEAVKRFQEQATDPANSQIADKLNQIARSAQSAKDALTAFLTKNADQRVLTTFAARLAEIRKELELGKKTDNLSLISDAFGKMTTLEDDLQQAITRSALAGNVAVQSRLNVMKLTLQELRFGFQHLVPTEFLKSIDVGIEKLKLLKENAPEGTITSTGIPLEQFGEANKQVGLLIIQQTELRRRIAQTEATGGDVKEMYAELLKLTKAIKEATPNLFDILFGEEFIPKIEAVANKLRQATSLEDAAKAAGVTGEAFEKIHLATLAAQGDLGRLQQQFLKAISGLSLKDQAEAIKGFSAAFKDAGGEASDFGESVDRVGRRLIKFTQIVAVLRQLAEAFGVMDKNIGKAITSAGVFLDSLLQLQRVNAEIDKRRKETAAKTGGDPKDIPLTFAETLSKVSAIIGAAVGAFNTIRSIGKALFGKSEAEIEHDRILKENNAKLQELSLSISGFTGSIGQQLQLLGQITGNRVPGRDVNASVIGRILAQGGNLLDPALANEVNLQLKQFGFTFQQINAIAEKNGIQLLDKNGRLVAGTMEQLAKAIEIARQQFFQWADTLSDQQKKLDLFNNVFNVEDTGLQQINDQLDLFSRLAPDLFKQFFSGVDLSDVTQVEKALQALTQAFLDGSLEASETLKLLDKDELIQIINGVAGGLDKLREATDDLTDSVLNVPQWFKRAQITFESVAARVVNNRDVPTAPPPITRQPPTQGGPDNPKPPLGPRQTVASVDADNFAAAAMTAQTLTVTRLELPQNAGLTVKAPDIKPVDVRVPNIPPVPVQVVLPANLSVSVSKIPPVQLQLPDIKPIAVEIQQPAPLAVKTPEIPPVTLAVADVRPIPVVLDTPKEIPVSIPTLPPLQLSLPNLPPVTANLVVPRLDPLPVTVADIPPVELTVPDIAPIPVALTVPASVPITVSDIPPVSLKLPEIDPLPVNVILPDVIPVVVPDIPPVALTLPEIKPIPVTIDTPETIPVSVPTLPPLQLSLPPIPPVPVAVTIPPIGPLPVTVADLPPVTLTLPEIKPLPVSVALPEAIPVKVTDIPAVQLALPTIDPIPVDLRLPETVPFKVPTLPPVELTLPPIAPIPVSVQTPDTIAIKLPDIPPVQLTLPPIPSVTTKLVAPDVVPVELPKIPPVELTLPAIPAVPVELTVPRIAPLAVTVAPIEPVPVTLQDIPTVPVAIQLPDPIPVAVPDIPPLQLTLPTIEPVPVNVILPEKIPLTIPPLAPVQLVIPPIAPIAADLKVPDSVRVDLPEIPPVQLTVPNIPPVPVNLVVPSLGPIPVTIPELPPVQLSVPDLKPIPVELLAPDIAPIQVTIANTPTVDVVVPPIDPVRVEIPKIPAVQLLAPELPELTLRAPEIPPLTIPPIDPIQAVLVMPPIPPVDVRLPEIPPVQLVAPRIPAISVDIAGVRNGQLESLSVATIHANDLVASGRTPSAAEPSVPQQTQASPSGLRAPAAVIQGGDQLNFNAPLIDKVVQQPGESTEEFAARVVRQLRREAFSRTGSSRLPGIDT